MREPESPVVHGHHPARIQIHECPRSVRRAGVHIAELRWIVGADRQKRDLWRQTLPDLPESWKIGCVSGVIQRMLGGAQHKSSIAAMRILDDPRSPVARRNMRDFER